MSSDGARMNLFFGVWWLSRDRGNGLAEAV